MNSTDYRKERCASNDAAVVIQRTPASLWTWLSITRDSYLLSLWTEASRVQPQLTTGAYHGLPSFVWEVFTPHVRPPCAPWTKQLSTIIIISLTPNPTFPVYSFCTIIVNVEGRGWHTRLNYGGVAPIHACMPVWLPIAIT